MSSFFQGIKVLPVSFSLVLAILGAVIFRPGKWAPAGGGSHSRWHNLQHGHTSPEYRPGEPGPAAARCGWLLHEIAGQTYTDAVGLTAGPAWAPILSTGRPVSMVPSTLTRSGSQGRSTLCRCQPWITAAGTSGLAEWWIMTRRVGAISSRPAGGWQHDLDHAPSRPAADRSRVWAASCRGMRV